MQGCSKRACKLAPNSCRRHQVFRNRDKLVEHAKRAHFVCNDADCRGGMSIFKTKDNLAHHKLRDHASKLSAQQVRMHSLSLAWPLCVQSATNQTLTLCNTHKHTYT